jgi:class 3 adenylate cyclase/tetratricopeptide (TPR) repeat protein
MRACPSCGTDNSATAKFCHNCGASLALACPSCGAPYDAGHAFCEECGTPLGETPAPLAPPPPREPSATERRLVSILFCDLVGSTALAESRDAEETRELLSRYFETCRRLIELYGGTVEKFIGDAVMAVWGTPTATEDDAERAVRAALDLVAAVSTLGDELRMPTLRARAAVVTGEAAVNLDADGEGMVAGDIVNTAARIQGIAEPGHVLVGEATRRATESTVVYEDGGMHELKGKVGLIPVWHALRVVSGARGTLKSQGLEPPFVGRSRELRLIKDLFHDSEREGQAQLVSVVGIAGIGKSRLSWEFYKYFDGIAQITYWHRGRCLSYGEGVTYWALADMVRMRARILEDEDAASARAKLRAVVEEHISDEDELRFVEPRLAHLLGLEEGTRYERDDLFGAWRLFFERLAAVYPVVMAFEDMQWADDSLLDFIEYLLDWSRSSPICVVTLARPELLERRPTWGAGRRNFTSLFLEPLSPQAMDELLTGLVPGLPQEARNRILERAEGIPLYAVETVRMLLDRGALVQDGPVYRPTGAIGELEVPETLHALIAARLDGLPSDERRLLQDAAVLGKTFTKRLLGALTELDETELDRLLSSLVRKEVLALQSDPRSPEHGQYGFLQDLIRHVAYETLPRRERVLRHLAAAKHLEESTFEEEEIVEVLASHYVDAYHAAGDGEEAEAIRDRAREMLRRAGERAASLAASAEATRYFVQAAELTTDVGERASLLDRAGAMAYKGARNAEARELCEEALAAYEAAGKPRIAAAVSARIAEIDFREGHAQAGLERLEATLAGLGTDELDEYVAIAEGQLGRMLVLTGRTAEGVPHLERALGATEMLGLPEVFANSLVSKSLTFFSNARLEEARILLEGALQYALDHELGTVAARAMNNLAVVFESQDRYASAIELTARGTELARRVGDRGWEQTLRLGSLSSYMLIGRWDEAFAMPEVSESFDPSEISAQWILLMPLVQIAAWRGELEKARGLFERYGAQSSDDAQSLGDRPVREALLLRLEGRPAEAVEHVEQALAAREELGSTFLTVKLAFVEALEIAWDLGDTARSEQLLAEIAAMRPGERPPMLDAHASRFRGKLDADPRALAAAETGFRELEMPFWLAVTLLEHGELLAEQGAEAAPLLEEAAAIFEQLRAQPWLERARLAGQSAVAT